MDTTQPRAGAVGADAIKRAAAQRGSLCRNTHLFTPKLAMTPTRIHGTIHTRLQQVFVRQYGDWSIASYHNVEVKGP